MKLASFMFRFEIGLKPLPNEFSLNIIISFLTRNYQLLLNCNKVHMAWRMAHRSIRFSRKGSIECCVAIITHIMDVSQQPPLAARGALPAQFGAHVMLLMQPVEHVHSVVPGLIPMGMEQPCNEAFQGSSPRS
jgi:hypothetical protein